MKHFLYVATVFLFFSTQVMVGNTADKSDFLSEDFAQNYPVVLQDIATLFKDNVVDETSLLVYVPQAVSAAIVEQQELFPTHEKNIIDAFFIDKQFQVVPFEVASMLIERVYALLDYFSSERQDILRMYVEQFVSGNVNIVLEVENDANDTQIRAPRSTSQPELGEPRVSEEAGVIDSQSLIQDFAGTFNDVGEKTDAMKELLLDVQDAMLIVDDTTSGVVTLGAGGNIVVPTTKLAANASILLTVQPGVVPTGVVYVSAITANTSFAIASNAGAADSGVRVYYQMYVPLP